MSSFLYEDLSTHFKFLERLLNNFGKKALFIAGKLPEDFPKDIPFPPEAEIIGSVVSEYDSLQVYFDVKFTPKQLIDFYLNNLEKTWEKLESDTKLKGFTKDINFRSEEEYKQVRFCDRIREQELVILIDNPEQNNKIEVSLYLYRSIVSAILFAPMPFLFPPSDVNISSYRGVGNSEEYRSSAKLKTSLDIHNLLEHYGNLFAREGWIKNQEEKTKNCAWQNWKKQDETGQSWSGMLTIAKLNDTYLANAYVLKEPE